MQIGIIGAGNVATHLTLKLYKAGVFIPVVVSKGEVNARSLAEKVGASYFSNLKKFHAWESCDFVLIAVKDDAILEVLQSGLLKGCNVIHTSGSFDSAQMAPYCKSHGAFYPFQTFRKSKAVDISEVPFFLEFSDASLMERLKELAKKISQHVFVLDSVQRRKLHVSGVFINNFVYFILDKMKDYCGRYAIDTNVLMPLLQQTIENAFQHGENLQTGPAVRGDKDTMHQHMDLLRDDESLQELYKIISKMIYKEANGKEIEL